MKTQWASCDWLKTFIVVKLSKKTKKTGGHTNENLGKSSGSCNQALFSFCSVKHFNERSTREYEAILVFGPIAGYNSIKKKFNQEVK